MIYGKLPVYIDKFDFDLKEVMYYLYMPVRMRSSDVMLPPNVECCREMILRADIYARRHARHYKYAYLSARKGWATNDNPLNRPGWHCDGFGTDDLNFVWWTGPSTRFAHQPFTGIVSDHSRSLTQFDEQIKPDCIVTYPEKTLFALDPSVVHATPIIEAPQMRQYIKVSFSDERYNLENNSHNYLFDYDWPMHSREALRNDPHRNSLDKVA